MSSPKLELSDNVKTRVGGRIRLARKKRGLTQGQLAGLIGLKGPAAVNKYEMGRALPPGEDLAVLAAALGVTVGWLFEESDKVPMVADPISEYGAGLTDEDREILKAVAKWVKKK